MEEIKEAVETVAPPVKTNRKKKDKGATDETFLRDYNGFRFRDRGPYEQTGQRKIDIHVLVKEKEQPEPVYSLYQEMSETGELNKGIERAKEWVNSLRRCRVCGCTEFNCIQCVEKTGKPCTWIEDDLCSACATDGKKEIEVKDSRATQDLNENSPQELVENISMPAGDSFFFQQLATFGNVDMTLRIMKVNGKFTIGVKPGVKVRGMKQLNITGTPEEFDNEFISVIMPQVKAMPGLITSVVDLKDDTKESNINSESQKKEKSKQPAKTKKKASKPALPTKKVSKPKPVKPAKEKKVSPKREKPVKPEKKIKEKKVEPAVEEPKVVEQSMF